MTVHHTTMLCTVLYTLFILYYLCIHCVPYVLILLHSAMCCYTLHNSIPNTFCWLLSAVNPPHHRTLKRVNLQEPHCGIKYFCYLYINEFCKTLGKNQGSNVLDCVITVNNGSINEPIFV